MGKKSKRGNRNGKNAKNSRNPELVSSDASTSPNIVTTDEIQIPLPPAPERGWAFELREAERAVKRDRKNSKQRKNNDNDADASYSEGAKKPSTTDEIEANLLRLAQAWHAMRQWKDLKQLAESKSVTTSATQCQAQMAEYLKQAERHLAIKTELSDDPSGRFTPQQMILELDKTNCDHPTYNNLNVIQYAAIQGDIRLLEKAIAMGAAIDYPVVEFRPNSSDPVQGEEAAPIGATALVMACAVIAMYTGIMPRNVRDNSLTDELRDLRLIVEGCMKCALQLVKLGADCDASLNIPPGSSGFCTSSFLSLGFNGKTASQLATLTGNTELIATMRLFKKVDGMMSEEAINLVHCRCGSRLPWNECHIGMLGNSEFCSKDQGKSLKWRFSPVAKCACKLTDKNYYRCCWDDVAMYQDDRTGKIHQMKKIAISNSNRAAIAQLINSLGVMNEKGFPGVDREQYFRAFRSKGKEGINTALADTDPGKKSRMRDWDMDIVVGCMERIENYFMWNDFHWTMPKSELLLRTSEWNKALDQYCDEVGTTESDRDRVIEKYSASSYAPCANPSCDVIEEKVKGFAKCSRCKSVAYCSRKCQAKNW
eukprot:CAMPEP_0194111774 /NCGR_PEP_ID=MMETSP0150-20130528/10702_1 /TAXON_ID=122233 /ORGANISM="Chaetoceros debilis, Strain MM31A-1" /LENGTH=595 /DNA_ID=CAMNT_0038801295 /DNA_START=124 /DNA_END=1908 /DNA_ORIENTATION=+